MIIAIVGLGYVGLPLAMAYLEAGHKVIGIDTDKRKIESLKMGQSYIEDVPQEKVFRFIRDQSFFVTDSYKHIRAADAIFICVPTPVHRNKQPNLSAVLSASASISDYIRNGQYVILQSTSYPGTASLVRETIKSFAPTKRFWVAFASERVNPGSGVAISEIPKVAGVWDDDQKKILAFTLKPISPQVRILSTPEAAEMSKLLENTFRAVNIALVNEFAMVCEKMHLDVWEVIDAAATKPYGFMPFYPGAGVGGHCIPVDPYFLYSKALEYGVHMRSIETAMAINEGMPAYVANLALREAYKRGIQMTCYNTIVIGSSYKPGVSDSRNAPSIYLSDELDRVVVWDKPSREVLEDIAVAIIATDDPEYAWNTLLHSNVELIIDCCDALEGVQRDSVVRLGDGTRR